LNFVSIKKFKIISHIFLVPKIFFLILSFLLFLSKLNLKRFLLIIKYLSGFFAFLLEQGPGFAKSVVDSLFAIGAGQGSASPAEIFDAGIKVASGLSQQARFGVFEDNALAIASVIAMGVVVIIVDMTRRVRRVRYRAEIVEKLDREANPPSAGS
jgi:type IV secretory pathway TrbL component